VGENSVRGTVEADLIINTSDVDKNLKATAEAVDELAKKLDDLNEKGEETSDLCAKLSANVYRG